MSEFLKLGRRRVSTAAIKTVEESHPPGGVVLHFVGGGVEELAGDEACAALEWADGCLVATPRTDAAKAKREKEAADEKAAAEKAEAAAVKAEAKAEAKADAAEAKAEHKAAHHGK